MANFVSPSAPSTGPYSVTVGGGGGLGLTTTALVNVTTLKTNSLANQALGIIANTPTSNTVLIGGSSPGSYGTTVTTIPASASVVVINNTDPTTVTNTSNANNQVIYAGIGTMSITDLGTSDTIVAGGGNDTFTFGLTSNNATLLADGSNTINVNASAGNTTIYATSASSDTIVGSSIAGGATGGGIVYISTAGSAAFIDPGSHNATVIGTAGGVENVSSVYGGVPFSGSLSLIDGTGYFVGGSAGNNTMGSSTVGSTTLVGGGANDVLSSKGNGDLLMAGGGAETLQGVSSVGGVTFRANNLGTDVMFANTIAGGGLNQGDLFYASNSTLIGGLSMSGPYSGYQFEGSFIDLHTNSLNQSTNTTGSEVVGNAYGAAQFATIGDFISGPDKLILDATSSIMPTITPGSLSIGGNSVAETTVTTSNGSTFVFLGTSTISMSDIRVIPVPPAG